MNRDAAIEPQTGKDILKMIRTIFSITSWNEEKKYPSRRRRIDPCFQIVAVSVNENSAKEKRSDKKEE